VRSQMVARTLPSSSRLARPDSGLPGLIRPGLGKLTRNGLWPEAFQRVIALISSRFLSGAASRPGGLFQKQLESMIKCIFDRAISVE
jgi:hypothetical protein